MQKFIDVYSGPAFDIHVKYSSILNIVFVTFMYGFGIPILFPLAAFQLFVIFVVEVLCLYFSYKQPPSYDEKISNTVVGLMHSAPLFYLAVGYWMCSSQQLLSNDHLVPRVSVMDTL